MADLQNVYDNEECFLAFRYKGYTFAMPLEDVGQIRKSAPDDARIIGDKDGQTACSYIVSPTTSGLLAISADEVYGLVNIPVKCQLELPPEAKSPENEWIFGVACQNKEKRVTFLLDCHRMA